MVMCKGKPDPRFASLEEMVNTHFHSPGGAKEYLERVSCRPGRGDQSRYPFCDPFRQWRMLAFGGGGSLALLFYCQKAGQTEIVY